MKIALGIDIGGTNTAFGFIDQEGNTLAEAKIPTSNHKEINDYINELAEAINSTFEPLREKHQLIGIGVGAPNANFHRGTIEHAANLLWKGVIPFVELLSKHFNLPIFINNDANTAAIGEMVYGSAKNMKNFIAITLGTGLGSGIVVNGQMQYGYLGTAGELGHIIITHNGRLCGCGRRGCLETYVSATGLTTTAKEILETSKEQSILRSLPLDDLNSKNIYKAALENDKLAKEIFNHTAQILGLALANYVAIANPEAIFLNGGLAKAGDLIFKPTYKAMEENMLHIFKGKTQLLCSGIEGNAAILGASAMVWKKEQ